MAGNIKEFNPEIAKITPSETGIDAMERAGKNEAESYRQAGSMYGDTIKKFGTQIEDYETTQEISQGGAALAVMHNNLSQLWNQTAQQSDPNDTSIQAKFLDQSEDTLSKWQDGFTTERGQKWAMEQANTMRSNLMDRTSADMSTRAGNAIIGNLKTTLDNLSQTAHRDPTTIDQALGQVDALISSSKEGSGGLLSVNQMSKITDLAAGMKSEIVKSGLKGLADTNPQAAIRAVNSGSFDNYLSEKDVERITGYANTQDYSRQVDADNNSKAQQLKMAQANDQANSKYVSALTQGQIPSAKTIAGDPVLSNQQKAAWIGVNGILSQSSDQLHTPLFGSNIAEAADAIYAGKPFASDNLLAGIQQGQISPAGAAQLQKMTAMMKTPEGATELAAQASVLNGVKLQLIKGGPGTSDPQGKAQYNAFLNTFYNTWDKAIQTGATPAQLSDPNDKAYIGSLAQQFKRPDAQALADVMQAAKSKTTPPAPPQTKAWVVKDGKLVPGGV